MTGPEWSRHRAGAGTTWSGWTATGEAGVALEIEWGDYGYRFSAFGVDAEGRPELSTGTALTLTQAKYAAEQAGRRVAARIRGDL